jgi:hypothetical protein
MTSTVSAIPSSVNARLEDATRWMTAMGEAGEYPPDTARNCVQAIRRLVTVFRDDEEANPAVAAFSADLERIADRYARLNPGKGNTVRTYRARAQTLVTEYLRYVENPSDFRPRKGRASRKPQAGPAEAAPRRTRSETGRVHTPPEDRQSGMREYPLDERRVFRFQFPDDGIDMDELMRVVWHMATLAKDFDPRVGLRPLLDGPRTISVNRDE